MRVRNDKQVRDFLPVSESMSAFGRIIENNYSGILNVGSEIGTSINSLARLFLETAGQEYLDIVATQPLSRISINVLDISETFADNTPVFTVPDGQYFFIGDNRDNSGDSRIPANIGGVGFVPFEQLIGRADRVIFSSAGARILYFWTWRKDRFFKALS